MATWISTLPAPKIDYGEDSSSPVITNKMEAGSTRQRLRFTAARKRVTASWIFTNIEYAVFEAFVRHELALGANSFTISLPQSGYNLLVPVNAIIAGGTYDSNALAGNRLWRVQCTLIIDEPNFIDLEFYEFILYMGSNNLETFSNLSNQLYNATNNLNMN